MDIISHLKESNKSPVCILLMEPHTHTRMCVIKNVKKDSEMFLCLNKSLNVVLSQGAVSIRTETNLCQAI